MYDLAIYIYIYTGDRRFSGNLWKSATSSPPGLKILTEPEPDRIGIIFAGTGPGPKPESKPKKVNRIDRILKTLTLNLQVTNKNVAASYYKALAL